jgi:hypothetical protein
VTAAEVAAGAGGRGAIGNSLVEARASALLIVPVRGTLALAGLAGARALGVAPGPALGLFAFGTGLVLFPLLTSRRRRLFWAAVAEAMPLDGPVSVETRLRTTIRAAYPSTIGLTVLMAIALAADAELAAFLAGTIAALGLGAAIHGAEVVLWERSRGRRLLLGPDAVYLK